MKKILSKTLAIAFISLAMYSGNVKACNNSSFTLVSLNQVGSGPTAVYTITTELCVGYGRTGVTFGADGDTGIFFDIAIYSPDPAIVTALTSYTSPLTGPPLPGGVYDGLPLGGAAWGLFNEQENLIFYDPLYTTNFACIASTAACGEAGSWCVELEIVFTGVMPDSLRALGIEGGVPFGGCWPNQDMLIDFTTLPVIWNGFSGNVAGGGVDLTWNTSQENNTEYFIVSRKNSKTSEFVELGKVDALNAGHSNKRYGFFDPQPVPGQNEYKVVLVDQDGNTFESETISIDYDAPDGLRLVSAWPIPTADITTLGVLSDKDIASAVKLYSISGQLLKEWTQELAIGLNEIKANLMGLPAGIYCLRLSAGTSEFEQKILKQ
jgi:hypothetical protein